MTTSTGTPVTSQATAGPTPVVRATILPTRGGYPGQPRAIAYQVDLVDVSQPSRVALNGKDMTQQARGATTVGWSYDEHTDTTIVNVGSISGSHAASVAAVGASPANQSDPAIASS